MSNTDFPTLTLDQILNGRKRAQTSIPLCLRLDVMSEIEELERRINIGKGTAVDDMRMTGPEDDLAAMAERIEDLEAIGRQYTVDLRIQALDRSEWPAVIAIYTTEDDDGNKTVDQAAVVSHVLTMPGVIVSPEMTTQQRDDLIAGLTDGQWETVLRGVWSLNRATVSVGKSLAASLVTRPKNSKPVPGEQ